MGLKRTCLVFARTDADDPERTFRSVWHSAPWPYVQAIDVFGTLLQHQPKSKNKRREKST
jgi:hypothetical protein